MKAPMAAIGSPMTSSACNISVVAKAAMTKAIAPTHQSIAAPRLTPFQRLDDLPAGSDEDHANEHDETAQEKRDKAQFCALAVIKRVGGEAPPAMPMMVGVIAGPCELREKRQRHSGEKKKLDRQET